MSDQSRIERLFDLTNLTVDLISTGIRGSHPGMDERLAASHMESGKDRAAVDSTDTAESAPASGASAPAAVTAPAPATAPTPSDAGLPRGERLRRLEELAGAIRSCTRCPLHEGRTNAVPGAGVLDPLVMIVGEGPGAQEDRQGLPFVGRAGQYLDRWLASIGLDRATNVFIANIVKCRPPGNRDPEAAESSACRPYLDEQIEIIRPRMILTVGRISMGLLTGSEGRITRIHGTFYSYKGIPLVPTFHPSAVLRNPDYRRPVWEDLKKVRNWLVDNAGHSAPDLP